MLSADGVDGANRILVCRFQSSRSSNAAFELRLLSLIRLNGLVLSTIITAATTTMRIQSKKKQCGINDRKAYVIPFAYSFSVVNSIHSGDGDDGDDSDDSDDG